MEIVLGQTKADMLKGIIDSIYDNAGGENMFHFLDDSGTELSTISFNLVQVEDDRYITFSMNSNLTLGGFISENGTVTKFYIPLYNDDTVSVLEGTVGSQVDFNADIKFNTTTWIAGETISISKIKITLEDVCLRR